MTDLTLAEALDRLDGAALLSPCAGTQLTAGQLRHQLTPEYLAAPVRLSYTRLAYVALNGESVAGWSLIWPCASEKDSADCIRLPREMVP